MKRGPHGFLIKCWQYLHGRAQHPKRKWAKRRPPMDRRYITALRKFERRHMGGSKGTMRFLNQYTAHRWM